MFIVPSDATSWVKVDASSHFSIQNIPFGLMAPTGRPVTLATAIGDYAVDLSVLRNSGYLSLHKYRVLDSFEEYTKEDLSQLRKELYALLDSSNQTLSTDKDIFQEAFVPLEAARMLLPIRPRAFVDFYSGIHHASNVGRMFRPEQPPLLPNYRHLPVGYNGRASSVVVSGTPIQRPNGQTKSADSERPTYGPTQEMDFELEMGFYTGLTSAMGEPVPIKDAADYMLGFVLVNDWSARDFQRWEYQPLGPFLAKSFATSVSPWVVLLDALDPFRIDELEQDPEPLEHLVPSRPIRYDVKLEVALKTNAMENYQPIAISNSKYLYWTFDQQLAHQCSNGTPLGYGDLYASGTISGPLDGSYGSLLELSWRGTKPIELSEKNESRTFLEDGDSLRLSGYCQGSGFRVGFGQVEGTILPANPI